MLAPSEGHVKNILWFYLRFHNCNNHQTWQDGRPAWANFILHVMLAPPALVYVKNDDGFIYNFISFLTNKLGRIDDQHVLTLGVIHLVRTQNFPKN